MSLGRPLGNQSAEINSVYRITLDMSGWDKTTIHAVGPMAGSLFVYGSSDGGSPANTISGSAELATNFQPIQATNLATGVATNTITAAGTYSVPINNQFLRLQGSPAAAGTSVYKLFLFNSKVS